MANDGAKIAAAMAAGYLIGRTRKARFVFAVVGGVLMAGRSVTRLGLADSRLGGVLSEVLADVQRGAGEALAARAGRFSESLRSQTEQLGGDQEEPAEEDEGGEEEEGEPDGEARAEGRSRGEDADGGGGDEEAPQPSREPDRGRGAGGRRQREPQAAGRGRR